MCEGPTHGSDSQTYVVRTIQETVVEGPRPLDQFFLSLSLLMSVFSRVLQSIPNDGMRAPTLPPQTTDFSCSVAQCHERHGRPLVSPCTIEQQCLAKISCTTMLVSSSHKQQVHAHPHFTWTTQGSTRLHTMLDTIASEAELRQHGHNPQSKCHIERSPKTPCNCNMCSVVFLKNDLSLSSISSTVCSWVLAARAAVKHLHNFHNVLLDDGLGHLADF